jgi:hypothetical protein
MVRGHRLPQVYGIIGGPDGGPDATAAVVDWLPPSEAGDHHPRQATMARWEFPLGSLVTCRQRRYAAGEGLAAEGLAAP